MLIGLTGCFCDTRPSKNTLPAAPKTYIVELPGMAGWTANDVYFLRGFEDAGISNRIEIYDWTTPNWLISAVRDWDHTRATARYVAQRISEKLQAAPDAKIILVAWSAGAAVAICALEDLPLGAHVQSVVLVEPCVDPNRDLSFALRHVRGHLFTIESCADIFALGIGTLAIGTADGNVHTFGAGLVGFRIPPAADARQYRKLVQLPWKSAYLKYGDLADHVTPMSRALAKDLLAPKLKADAEIGEPHE